MFSLSRRVWFWVAVVLMAISTGIATAQVVDYCIKVTYPTNIRSSYSLDSQIWAMVSAGTVLHVTYEGIHGNWLQVDYLTGSAWIARWLDYSEVSCGNEAPAPTPAPTPAPQPSQQQSQPQPAASGTVDNMCQIGWTCTTELDWVRGWHAYRDGQTQQQTQPTTQTTGQTTGQPIGNQGGELHVIKGTFQLPTGCKESFRYEGTYFNTLRITCESPQKITDPVDLSWFSCDAYISARSSWYSEYRGIWHTSTTYDCDHRRN